ncbi:phosphodiesterase [bacterium]|nr:phosphodiesterase [bacterium]
MTNRREFLQAAGLSLLTPFVVLAQRTRTHSDATDSTDPATVFGLSIASGDPSPVGVVLWTRINPEQWSVDEHLLFEVSRDPNFRQPVMMGEVEPTEFAADRDYTVHLDLDGHLAPGETYYYRFEYRGVYSRGGRCRTLPDPSSTPHRLRLGVVTCQDYTNGYYAAFSHLAMEDVDFLLHLGDFIYESVGDPAFQPLPYADRQIELPSGQPAAIDLNDYRHLYRTYRSDPLFQSALEAHTLICLWDDHETANDCYWDYDRDTLGAPDHPLTKGDANGGNPQLLKQLKLDSQRAWTEYVPARVVFNSQATHPFNALQIYRPFQFGSLVELFVTDERTYRSAPPCGPDNRTLNRGCEGQIDPDRSMLGITQRDWFLNGVTTSQAIWKVWANEVFLGQVKLGRRDGKKLYINLDAWDGFEAERQLLLQTIGAAGVENFVALTGDFHCYIASYLKVDYSKRSNRPGKNLVGVEFMTPAVTSSTFIDYILSFLPTPDVEALQADDAANPSRFYFENVVKATNPHIHFFDSQEWGYSIVEFTPRDVTYSAYSVDKSVNSFTADKRLIRQLRVPVNRIQFQDIV